MPAARISITIPEELLRAADTRAAVERRSRSWVLSEAVAAFTDPAANAAFDERIPAPAPPVGAGWLASFPSQRAYLDWKARDPAAHRSDDFRLRLAELCGALARHSARYLLVGSAALLLLGASRTHTGMELLVHPSKKNVKRTLAALHELGADMAVPELAPVLAARAVTVAGDLPRADLLTAANGLVQKELRGRASIVHVEGVEIHIAAIGDVVAGGVT